MSNQKTTFRTEDSRKLIESARLSAAPLKAVIGTLFKLESEHREVSVNRQTNERTVRDVVDVRTLNSQLLPVGTMLQIKMKNVKPLLSKEDQQSLLLGAIQAVVGFEDIMYWSIGNNEGLTASSMFITDISLQDAIGVAIE
ncbi:Putative uncharacterized protein [Lactobacillus equicursoris DSM 19284 = JCM 14600 = CIP 110162]|nr:hypothetical protein [Lactobacillus equicursoris]CCK85289.1 Putative uncharacterized protein [Lactobacillus equicursoris DSM 19284 = JCM 14600 = CIP 110162]